MEKTKYINDSFKTYFKKLDEFDKNKNSNFETDLPIKYYTDLNKGVKAINDGFDRKYNSEEI